MSERCKHCGTPWVDHPGIEEMCKELQEARKDLPRKKARAALAGKDDA